jgi:hypothetical protein
MRALGTSLCFAVLLFAVPETTFAGGPASPTPEATVMTDKARQLYEDGLAAIQKSKWLEGRAALLAAWSLNKHWQIAANLAGCEVELGKFRDASEHAAFYLKNAPADRRAKAEALLARAKQRIAVVTVVAEPAGADLQLDGTLIGQAPLSEPLFVEPGDHVLVLRAAGMPDVAQRLTVGAGESRTIPLKPPPTPPPAPQRSVIPGAVLGGVAGAALVTGIGLFAGGRAKQGGVSNTHDAILQAGHSCVSGAANYDSRCPGMQSSASTGNTFQKAGVGLMIGAGAAAIGTAVYFLLPASKSTAPNTGRVQVSPALGPGARGLVLSGSF